MTITQQLGALGSWSVTLVEDTPRAVTDALDFFGHIALWRGRVDVEQTDDADLLTSARYVGVLREKPDSGKSLEGSGMVFWLGDEDGKGAVLEDPVVFTAASLTDCVTTLLPPAVTVGTIHDPGGTYSGRHQWQTPRAVLDTITTAFGVEYRVNGDGSVDVGTAAQLYGADAKTIISARGAGTDYDLTSLGADFTTDTAVTDYTSRIVLLGQKTDDAGTSTNFVEATADAVTLPHKDLRGNPVRVTRLVSDAGQTDASAPAAAQLQLNLYNRAKRAVKITAGDYDMSSAAVVGQDAYVYDPANGLYDPETQIDFRGELIFPVLIRISAVTWPITEGHTVAFRTGDGEWIDLTRWVAWETGSDDITVGDLPKTLTSTSNPVLDQTNTPTPGSDESVPNPPSGLALTTTSVESSIGQSTATVTASWTAPAQNTDGSVIQDLSHYLVQYRWQGRAPLWDSRIAPTTSIDIPGLAVGLVYDVQVAAVDTTGHVSAWTPIESITAAPDQDAPNPPSDPVVSYYLGQLRIAWDGKDNAGAAMPSDFSIVEVHVSATSGFVPDSAPGSATLVSELSTAGVAYATAPYGATRYVKLVAVDNSGNRSAPSGQASGASSQVVSADIFDGAVGTAKLADLAVTTAKINDLAVNDAKIGSLSVGKLTAGTMSADVVNAGRLASGSLTGERVEQNALGIQGFQSDGITKWLSLTATESLLTGTFKTALSGRRIEIGAGGTTGEVALYAPDGTKSFFQAYTETTGLEAIQFGIELIETDNSLWNRINFNNDHGGYSSYRANKHEFVMGGPSGAGGSDPAHAGLFHVVQTSSYGGATGAQLRFQIDGSSTQIWDSAGKERLAIDTNLVYWDSTGRERLAVDTGGLSYWDGNGKGRLGISDGGFTIWAADGHERVRSDDVKIYLSPTSDGSSIQVHPGGSGGVQSAKFQLLTAPSSTGGVSGIILKFSGSTGLEVRNVLDSGFEDCYAFSFQTMSDASLKTDITDLEPGALAKVAGTRVHRYRMKQADKRDRKLIGLIAQEAPAEIVTDSGEGKSIDLYQMSSLQWAALRELAAEVAALRGGKP